MTCIITRRTRCLALLSGAIVLVFALFTPVMHQASAQDVATPTPGGESGTGPGNDVIWEELEGVDQAILRLYSPTEDRAPGATDEAGPDRVIAILVRFDSSDSAADALDAVVHWTAESLQLQDMSSEVTERDAGEVSRVGEHDLDAEHVRVLNVSIDAEDETSDTTVVGVQADDSIAVSAVTVAGGQETEGAADIAIDIAASITAAEPSDEPVTQNEAGHFSGGDWSRLPDEGDDVLQGLMINSDLQLYPEDTATPEA